MERNISKSPVFQSPWGQRGVSPLAGAARHPREGGDPRYNPAHSASFSKGGWVYIITNKPNGILYTGVTSNLAQRIEQHKNGTFDGFSKRYGLKTLVWSEHLNTIEDAIRREKQIKKFNRAWKIGLILQANASWADLTEDLHA